MPYPTRLQAKSEDFIYWVKDATSNDKFRWRPPHFHTSPGSGRLNRRRITPPGQHLAAKPTHTLTPPEDSEPDKEGVPRTITCEYVGRLKVKPAHPQKTDKRHQTDDDQDSGYMVAVSTADSAYYVIAGDLPEGDTVLALPPARRLGPALQLCSDRRFSHAKLVKSHDSNFWTLSEVGEDGFLVEDETLTDEYTFHDYLNTASSILTAHGEGMKRAHHIAKKLELDRAQEAALANRLSYGYEWRGFAESIFNDLEGLTLSSSIADLERCRDHVYAQTKPIPFLFSDCEDDEYELRFFHHQIDYPPSHRCTWPCDYCTAEPNDLPLATAMAFRDPTDDDEVSFIMPFATLQKRGVDINSGIVVARNISKKEYWALDGQSLTVRAEDAAEDDETDEDSSSAYAGEPAARGLLRGFAVRMVQHDTQAYQLSTAQGPIRLQPLLGDSGNIEPAVRYNGTISVFMSPSEEVSKVGKVECGELSGQGCVI